MSVDYRFTVDSGSLNQCTGSVIDANFGSVVARNNEVAVYVRNLSSRNFNTFNTCVALSDVDSCRSTVVRENYVASTTFNTCRKSFNFKLNFSYTGVTTICLEVVGRDSKPFGNIVLIGCHNIPCG